MSPEEFAKLQTAKATSVMVVERIDLHTELPGEPVTVHDNGGLTFKLPQTMQAVGRRAFDALSRGASGDVGRGKLLDILTQVANSEGSLSSCAEAVADKICWEFEALLREAVFKRVADCKRAVIIEACDVVLR